MQVLSGIGQKDYYVSKIESIKQDIRDNEQGIRDLYNKKSDLIRSWAKCLEEIQEIPVNTIAKAITDELIRLDCKRGVRHAYKVLDSKYKRNYKHDMSELGDEEEESDVTQLLEHKTVINLPHTEDVSLQNMAPEDLQENKASIRSQIRSLKQREQEYDRVMHDRNIPELSGQKHIEIESTPHPYDPVKGHFFHSCVGLAGDFHRAGDTFEDISEKIEQYPPATEIEDKKLAAGIDAWRTLIQGVNENVRPYADLKFSQSYPDWWKTLTLNRDFGKHAAAVKSKVKTLSGKYRSLTREQVGDKIPDLADKAINFKGALELANIAFELLQEGMPKWRKERVDPSVGTRKENLSPKLSESAFGADTIVS